MQQYSDMGVWMHMVTPRNETLYALLAFARAIHQSLEDSNPRSLLIWSSDIFFFDSTKNLSKSYSRIASNSKQHYAYQGPYQS